MAASGQDSVDQAIANADATYAFVTCGCLIGDGDGRYLLVRETKAMAWGKLLWPGGRVEAGESLQEAAMREVQEETGIDVRIDGLLGIYHSARTREGSSGATFLFSASRIGGEITTSAEHPEVVWRTSAEIAALLESGELRGRSWMAAIEAFESGSVMPLDLVVEIASACNLD